MAQYRDSDPCHGALINQRSDILYLGLQDMKSFLLQMVVLSHERWGKEQEGTRSSVSQPSCWRPSGGLCICYSVYCAKYVILNRQIDYMLFQVQQSRVCVLRTLLTNSVIVTAVSFDWVQVVIWALRKSAPGFWHRTDTILIVPAAVSEQWLAVASQHTIHSAPAVFKRCYPLLYNSLCFVHSPVKSSSGKQQWPLWTQQCWLVSDLMNGMDHFSATSLTSSKIKSSINAHGKLPF